MNVTPAQFNKGVSHPLQTYEWGRYCHRLGFKVIRHRLKEDPGPSFGVQAIIQKSVVRNHNLAYVPRAPLPGRRQISYLKTIAKKHACISLKIEPCYGWLYPMTSTDKAEKRSIERKIHSQGGLNSRGVYPQHTLLISLEGPDPALLGKMHSKTRYNIRLAERKGVAVTRDNSDQCFEEFLHLFFNVTVVRAGIAYPHSPETLRLFWKIMKPTGMLHLLKATYRGETAAVMMLFKAGDRLYFPHGASSRVYKNAMVNYALMWQAMLFGKKTGCSVLDLWGVQRPAADSSSPGRGDGLFRFYSGFGAKVFQWLGAYDFIL